MIFEAANDPGCGRGCPPAPIGFRMQLKPGCEDEYRRRHDAIWPELAGLLDSAGLYDYHIYLDPESLALFAVFRLKDPNQIEDLPLHPLMQQWWDYMADLMLVEQGNRPMEWPLRRMFSLN